MVVDGLRRERIASGTDVSALGRRMLSTRRTWAPDGAAVGATAIPDAGSTTERCDAADAAVDGIDTFDGRVQPLANGSSTTRVVR